MRHACHSVLFALHAPQYFPTAVSQSTTENTAFHQAVLKVEDLPAYATRVSNPETVDMLDHQKKLVDVLPADEETFWRSVSKPIQMDWPIPTFEEQP